MGMSDSTSINVTLTLGEWRRLINAARRPVPNLVDRIVVQFPCVECGEPIQDEGGLSNGREGKRWHAKCYALATMPAALREKLAKGGSL